MQSDEAAEGISARLHEQQAEIGELRATIEKLRLQNERMQASMRHCITCEYREEVEASR